MNISSEELTLIGTLSGVIIGSLATIIITWINKRSEERRHKREIIIRAATESWKQSVELVEKRGGKVESLDIFIIHLIKLSEVLLTNKNLTSENIISLLKEIDKVTDLASDYRKQEYENKIDNLKTII